jgi:hypothetical protein
VSGMATSPGIPDTGGQRICPPANAQGWAVGRMGNPTKLASSAVSLASFRSASSVLRLAIS